MRKITLLCFTVLYSLASGLVLADTIYLEENGVVAFEAEGVSAPSGWTAKTDIEGHLGSSYYEYTGNADYTTGDVEQSVMRFTFRISTSGNYQMHWRTRIATGNSFIEANDSWVRLSTAKNIFREPPINGWIKVYG